MAQRGLRGAAACGGLAAPLYALPPLQCFYPRPSGSARLGSSLTASASAGTAPHAPAAHRRSLRPRPHAARPALSLSPLGSGCRCCCCRATAPTAAGAGAGHARNSSTHDGFPTSTSTSTSIRASISTRRCWEAGSAWSPGRGRGVRSIARCATRAASDATESPPPPPPPPPPPVAAAPPPATATAAAASADTSQRSLPGAAAAAAAPPSAAEGGGSSPEHIRRRIAAAAARRAARVSYNCPACSISVATPANAARHLSRCCPDLMGPDAAAWEQLESLPRGRPQHDAVVPLLRAAGGREQQLRRRVLACVFWSGPLDPDTGLPARLEAEAAAARLGLPLSRASSLLRAAMASVPLASDPGGPPLEVVFEDEHFLAVNKPIGLHTAPIHRFTGGSVVNQVIAYLNRGRGGRPGGSQVTLLTPPPASAGLSYDSLPDLPHGFLPELMPVPEPFSTAAAASSYDDQHGDPGTASSSYRPQLEPYVLHRLDMNTSGLLLFAKRIEVVAGVHQQFRERTLAKLYVAAAVGCVAGERFRVDAPLDRHPSVAVARVVADTGKEASTSFAVLARNPLAPILGPGSGGGAPGLLFTRPPPHTPPHQQPGGPGAAAAPRPASLTSACLAAAAAQPPPPAAAGSELRRDLAVLQGGLPYDAAGSELLGASLLVCAPHTGRTHQIRVHLQHAGHPIVGDDMYGVTGPWLPRQALHAAALRFTHPLTGRPVHLAAPLHPDMADGLSRLGLPQPDVGSLAADWSELAAGGGTKRKRGGGA